MRQATRAFLLQFNAAFQTSKPQMVVRTSRAALQCCAIFRDLGLIENYTTFVRERKPHWGELRGLKRLLERRRLRAEKEGELSPPLSARERGIPHPSGRRGAHRVHPSVAVPTERRQRRGEYLCIWFAETRAAPGGYNLRRATGAGHGAKPDRALRLELFGGVRFLSLRELRRLPSLSQIYLLESPRGIVSGSDALRFGVGGFLIGTLRL